MKRIALVLLLVVALAPPAMADQITVNAGLYQTGSGGEFQYNVVNSSTQFDTAGYASTTTNQGSDNSFQTFCIETSEHIGFGNTYNANLNNEGAVNGGYAGGSPDPISQGTAWLYSQFAQGILGGYSYTGTAAERQASANALQQTIWWLENENPAYFPSLIGNIFYAAVIAQFGANAQYGIAGTSAAYGVYAINMWNANGTVAQDALFYSVPDGGTTLMLLGGALLGLGALRRKFGR